MKPINFILTAIVPALILFGPASAPAQDQKPPVEDPAHQELRQLRDDFLAAMNKSDLNAALAFVHTNCVITWHNAEVSRGHAGVRDYSARVMSGPNRIVDSFNCTVNVEELAILYGGDTAICFGSSDEHFKLTSGRNLNIKGRWSATLVKENGRWLIANLHASTDLFNNVMLDLAKRMVVIVGMVSLAAGIVLGWFLGRRRKSAAATT